MSDTARDLAFFPKDRTAGIFRGFSHGGLEFQADIVLPYRRDLHSAPMHGQFLLVQLANEDEAVLGRVTSLFSDGRMASGEGEEYGLRAVAEDRPVPEDLLELYVKYRVRMRVLGVLRRSRQGVVFAPSHRRLPHVGSKVSFPSDAVLREVAAHNVAGADLGFLAFGEFIYGGGDDRLTAEPWMQVLQPVIVPKFPISQLVARRSYVFARAGFGKSNLVKLLFSNLYREVPTVAKRGERQVPVGTVIFDPEGEYFWPDEKGRPGLCDVPELEDKVVVFTPRQAPSAFYGSFVAGDIKLDLRRLRPADVLSISLSPERQEQQNVRKLMGLKPEAWEELVDLIADDGNAADLAHIRRILKLEEQSDAEAIAARSNMTHVVKLLHDRGSRLMDMLIASLRDGRLCVVDVSKLKGPQALMLTGLILRRVFETNQDEFVKREPKTIPTIAVLEEAQSVLGQSEHVNEEPYVAWVKEGRKYDLGTVLITQQPGSIRQELLSQGDNWFIFHLLSSGDLNAVQRANAHFSEDLLASLLNEPIPGHCVFWSSAGGKAYPLPLRVLSFESGTRVRDREFSLPSASTYARQLRQRFDEQLASAFDRLEENTTTGLHTGDALVAEAGGVKYVVSRETPPMAESSDDFDAGATDIAPDVFGVFRRRAIAELRGDKDVDRKLRTKGMPWRGLIVELERHLPPDMDNRENEAHNLVRPALNEIYGPGRWTTEARKAKTNSGMTTWVVLVNPEK